MLQTYLPLIRYVIARPINPQWWHHRARPYLESRGWTLVRPEEFDYESSYGYRPIPPAHGQTDEMRYALHNAGIIIEYHGEPELKSWAETLPNSTLIDDVLAFLSIYSGVYWQWIWKEWQLQDHPWGASSAIQVNSGNKPPIWAGDDLKVFDYFEISNKTAPQIAPQQLTLALNWLAMALYAYQDGNSLLDPALHWVVLESQAKFLFPKGKQKGLAKVKQLLGKQGFPKIPRLHDLYELRNKAFHEGNFPALSKQDVQVASNAGRALVRAQVLNLLGMKHTDFSQQFVNFYAT